MSAASTVLALEASLTPDAGAHEWAHEWTPDACTELVVPSRAAHSGHSESPAHEVT